MESGVNVNSSKQLSESQSETVIHLNTNSNDENRLRHSWWRKRKDRICRKKTLFMRVPILKWLPNYTTQDFLADLIAGITVGIVVIPQGLAYSTVAGLPPQFGLYAAYMGCFVCAIFGSTHAITIGPTALMALVTYDSGAYLMGPEAAIVLSFITGCIVFILGLLNFGFLIDFVAAPVVAGFTTAATFTIATIQIKPLLGLEFDEEGFLNTWIAIFEHIEDTKKWDAVFGFASVAILLLLRILDKLNLGKEGERTRWQNWFNAACWLISVGRNAIVTIAFSVMAYYLSEPGQSAYPFTLTGKPKMHIK